MSSTTVSHQDSLPADGVRAPKVQGVLLARYFSLTHEEYFEWVAFHRKLRPLGKGGQGEVFLSERHGTDGFSLPVALKVFSPEPYVSDDHYHHDMAGVARAAARVALIQHDNLIDIQGFDEQHGIRIMEMEWVDGFDLRTLLGPDMLEKTRSRVTPERWEYIHRVILAEGPRQPRFKAGIAIQVLRECLAGLGALHREGIVHGDVKPSNIMLKRTGNAKVIDIGSALDLAKSAARRLWSPVYAAPEVLRGGPNSAQADLASLGYVLVEMLAGQSPFEGLNTRAELLQAKATLVARLPQLLPEEVSCNELLLHLCRRLVAPDPAARFPDAQAADLDRKGAADFHRQLVKNDLASEYENDLRVWLEQLD
jgi:serine/threonine protein kinase